MAGGARSHDQEDTGRGGLGDTAGCNGNAAGRFTGAANTAGRGAAATGTASACDAGRTGQRVQRQCGRRCTGGDVPADDPDPGSGTGRDRSRNMNPRWLRKKNEFQVRLELKRMELEMKWRENAEQNKNRQVVQVQSEGGRQSSNIGPAVRSVPVQPADE